ncbi:polysialyltransferase family glycosyltransferase [Yimella sp. cx-51]|uniref:polysialyltransferase family glycosyltransferase n=1 Tax=Yimella sp. cx-51 TaxID=2770551 RepID=UPI00165E5C31|nr:polysialyltransferase family glycosyltransferase [Yimella sp. cx-51]MBC9958094.1 hypothetical protein [Yimella sp. cx-51]QTH38861.1 hypothetical protein J5M86_04290 [Yimella sp. cx-51]
MRCVITGVRSRTHLVHIAAYLRHRLASTDEPLEIAYIGGGQFLGNASVDRQDVTRILPSDARVHITFPEGDARWRHDGDRLTYLSVGAPGIKPWLQLRRASARRKIDVVVTDEGIGTYGDRSTRRDALARQGVGQPWRSVRAFAVDGAARTLTTTRWAMYDKADGWALNEHIADEFRSLTTTVPDGRSDRVVFLAQPWVELGVLDETAYLQHIAQIAQVVGQQGLRLAVRPHPAENTQRYRDYEVLDTSFTAEVDPQIVSAAGVVGGTSTALLNLAALYRLPAARLVVPGLEHLEDDLGTDQRALLDAYLPRATEVGQWGGLQSSM